MAIETICAGCGKRLAVADENAGKRARCPACGYVNPIPLEPSDRPRQDFASPSTDDSAGLASDVDALGSATYQPPDAFAAASGADRTDTPPDAQRYWMRAVDGTEYGPVDQQTLQRWFREGRVGPGYQVRQSRYDNWRPAEEFRTAAQRPSANPFAQAPHDSNPYQPVAAGVPGQTYLQADQGVFVLVMGLLGILCCPVFGLVAWVVGHQALNSIQAGLANPNSKGLVQIGYYLGIASVVMFLVCSGGRVLMQFID